VGLLPHLFVVNFELGVETFDFFLLSVGGLQVSLNGGECPLELINFLAQLVLHFSSFFEFKLNY
jgi:hypothetical protein